MTYSQSPTEAVQRLAPRKLPTQRRSAETVGVILEGAARVLERKGFEGYTPNDIAARAGVSIGSLYHYFPNRDAITGSLIDRHTSRVAHYVKAALLVQDPSEALREMIDAAVQSQLTRPQLAKILDYEERRLASVLPRSSNAAIVRSAIVDFLVSHEIGDFGKSVEVAADIMAITKALTDAAGQQSLSRPSQLEAAIRGAVFGYLELSLCRSVAAARMRSP